MGAALKTLGLGYNSSAAEIARCGLTEGDVRTRVQRLVKQASEGGREALHVRAALTAASTRWCDGRRASSVWGACSARSAANLQPRHGLHLGTDGSAASPHHSPPTALTAGLVPRRSAPSAARTTCGRSVPERWTWWWGGQVRWGCVARVCAHNAAAPRLPRSPAANPFRRRHGCPTASNQPAFKGKPVCLCHPPPTTSCCFADDIVPLVERSNNLGVAAPLSGTSLYADCWCIPAAAAGG